MERGSLPERINCKECTHCGFCCRGWDVYLSKEDIRKIVGLGYPIGHFLELNPFPVLKMSGERRDCVFLNEKTLCELHEKHGYRKKPYSCRLYPRQVRHGFSKNNDYVFYTFGGKVLTRDLLSGVLEGLKERDIMDYFGSFFDNMRNTKAQKEKFLDLFNFEEGRERFLGNPLDKMKIRMWAARVDDKDKRDLESLGGGSFESLEFIGELQGMIKENKLFYPNLPEKLLRFFYLLRNVKHPPYTEELLEYMDGINRKYH